MLQEIDLELDFDVEAIETNIEIPDSIDICDLTTEGIINEEDPTVPQFVKTIKETDILSWNNKMNQGDSLTNSELEEILK